MQIQLHTGSGPIVYKSNLEAQNHVLEIIYTLHHKLQGTPMTKKTSTFLYDQKRNHNNSGFRVIFGTQIKSGFKKGNIPSINT